MGTLRRRLNGLFGIVTLMLGVAFGGLLITTGRVDWRSLSMFVGMVCLIVSGLLEVTAWHRDAVTVMGRTLRWSQVDGFGTIFVAAGFVFASLPTALSDPFFGVSILVGGGALAWIGYQGAVDGKHVDFEAEISRKRSLAMVLLTLGSVALGSLLFVLVG